MSYQSVSSWARQNPTKSALVHNGTPISYGAFAGAISGTIDELLNADLPEGYSVGILESNLHDAWVVALAAQALGYTTVAAEDVAALDALNLGNAVPIVFTESEHKRAGLQQDDATDGRIRVIRDPGYDSEDPSGLRSLPDTAGQGGHIIYTSGTTGHYKMLFASSELQGRRDTERIEQMGLDKNAVFHCLSYGIWTAAGYKMPPSVWQAGGCAIFDQRSDWYDHYIHSGMTEGVLIPSAVDRLLESLDPAAPATPLMDFNLILGAGFVSQKSVEQLLTRVTTRVEIGYGSTEVSIAVLQSFVEELGDVHWLSPIEYRVTEIVDENGDPCPVDVEGQIRVQLTELDFIEYMDDVEASDKVFRDGYFYPGDMAVRRADGRVRILGRSVDVLNLRGLKVAVAPLEEKIKDVLEVRAVCLFGGLSEGGDEEILVALETSEWPEKSGMNHVNNEFQQFGRVRFVMAPEFPRTRTGTDKIDRVALRNLIYANYPQD